MCQPHPGCQHTACTSTLPVCKLKDRPIDGRPFAQWNRKTEPLWRTTSGHVSYGCGSSCVRFHVRSYNSLQKIYSLAKAAVYPLQFTIEIGRLSLLRTGFSPQHKYLPRRQDMLQAPISFPTGGMSLINSLQPVRIAQLQCCVTHTNNTCPMIMHSI